MYYYITVDDTGLITSRCSTYEEIKGAIQLSQSQYNNGLSYTHYDKIKKTFYNLNEANNSIDDTTLIIELLAEMQEQLFEIQDRLDSLEV